MKKLPLFLAFLFVFLFLVLAACNDKEQTTWESYTDWREANNAWLNDLMAKKNDDGSAYYKKIVPDWNPGSFVLIHYYNDRELTEGKLSPINTSTINVRYHVSLYEGTPVDSSSTLTANGPGIFRCRLNNMIQAWSIAIPDMRCGDTAEIICPYGVAYGSSGQGSIPPYSNLRFGVRLVDIPHLESSPY